MQLLHVCVTTRAGIYAVVHFVFSVVQTGRGVRHCARGTLQGGTLTHDGLQRQYIRVLETSRKAMHGERTDRTKEDRHIIKKNISDAFIIFSRDVEGNEL